MELHAGSSGFSYPAWKGPFYPEDLPASRFLAYYADRLPTVEINNTFYRMPRAELLGKWAQEVAAVPGFRFVLKAPQRITHKERLRGSGDSLAYLWKVASTLGDRLGPILFQLPPSMKLDLERLRDFLAGLPAGMRAAFEFRHESWQVDTVFETLRAAGAALCVADVDDGPDPAVVATADWGYLRLRRENYSDAALGAWAERIAAQPWREAFVFFKHEDSGAAPRMALRMLELATCR